MILLPQFEKHLKTQFPLLKETTIIIGVSGGVDSMVLLHLFQQLHYNIIVAHVNFQLRAEEANLDTHLVKKYCIDNNIQYRVKQVDTNLYAQQNKMSIQASARKIRMDWFAELLQSENASAVALAHHANDQAETIVYNLSRGINYHGFGGIRPQKGILIRPLLPFLREQIELYQQHYKVPFRLDKSNLSTKYTRNFIRHTITPKLEEVNPKAITNISNASRYFQEIEAFVTHQIKNLSPKVLIQQNDYWYFNWSEIDAQFRTLVSFELLQQFSFRLDQIEQALLTTTKTGAQFTSATHVLLVDRNKWIIKKISSELNGINLSIEQIPFELEINGQIIKGDFCDKAIFDQNSRKIYLDFNQLQFPLKIRNWVQGDKFRPFGMKGMKKLSKLFIDQKFSLNDKTNALILENEDSRIIWLINHRLDDRFRLSNSTKKQIFIETFPSK